MYYFLIFVVIFLIMRVWRLTQKIDQFEKIYTKAIEELERRIAHAELEKREAELSELNKKWFKLQDEWSEARGFEDKVKIEKIEEATDSLNDKIEALEETIKYLRWARR